MQPLPPLDPAVVPILRDPAALRARLDALHQEYDQTRAAGQVLHLYPLRERLIMLEGLFCTELSPAARGDA